MDPLLCDDQLLEQGACRRRSLVSADGQKLRLRIAGAPLWSGIFTARNLIVLVLALFAASGEQPFAPRPTPASAQPATPVGEASQPEQNGAYPVRYVPLSASAREARQQLFLRRNGPDWSSVRFDEFGFIAELTTTDPTLTAALSADNHSFTAAERMQWQKFIADNADLFGVNDPTALAPVVETLGQEQRLSFQQRVGNWPVGTIRVFKSLQRLPVDATTINVHGHFWPDAALPAAPRVGREAIVNAVTGTPYAFEQELPGYPCDPVAPAAPPCATPPSVIETSIRLQASDLRLDVHPYLVRRDEAGPLELRLVYQADVQVQTGGRTPLEASAVWPKLFDAMTGEELTGAAWTCSPDAPATNCIVSAA
jgi:hypothetical protein